MNKSTRQNAKKNETRRENIISRKPKKKFSQAKHSPVDHILHLQRTIGNRAVTRLIQSGKIQAKYIIGKPDSIHEKEADHMANLAVNTPDSAIHRRSDEEEKDKIQAKPLAEQITPLVQRESLEEDDKELNAKLLDNQQLQREEMVGDEEENIDAKLMDNQQLQREEGPGDEEENIDAKLMDNRQLQRETGPEKDDEEDQGTSVMAKAAPGSTPKVTSNVESNINSMKGGGQPLSESTRSFFEPRFGADFSQVRVHTDSRAAETAQAINAKAFTTGKDIFFNSGQYAPGTTSGDHLAAHELTHVMQQGKISGVKKNSYASRKTPNAFLQSSGIVLQRKRKLNPQKVKYANQQLWKKYPKIKGQRLRKSNAYALFRNEWWAYYRGGGNKVTGEKNDRQKKLDPQKVKYANQQLWEKYPKLKGRRLTKSRAFTILAKEWWKYYRMGKTLDPQGVKYANQKFWARYPGHKLTAKDPLRWEWWRYYEQWKKKKVDKKSSGKEENKKKKVTGKKYDPKKELKKVQIYIRKMVAKWEKEKYLKNLGISSSVLTILFAELQKGKNPPNVYMTLLKRIDSFLKKLKPYMSNYPRAVKIIKSISSGLEKIGFLGAKVSKPVSITDLVSNILRIYYKRLERKKLLIQINNHFRHAGYEAQMAWRKIGGVNPNISGQEALRLLNKLVKKNNITCETVIRLFRSQNMENRYVKDLADCVIRLKQQISRGYEIFKELKYISKKIAKYIGSVSVNIASLIPIEKIQLYALVGSAVMLTDAPDRFLASDFLDWMATKISIVDRDTVTKKIIKLGMQPKIRFYQIR